MTTTESLKEKKSYLPPLRLCHIKKPSSASSYGFSLVCDETVEGSHFIGSVDPGSPAEAASLIEGDKVIGINGINVRHENHQQVAARIKFGLYRDGIWRPDEVMLLVADRKTLLWYQERKIDLSFELPFIQCGTSSATENGRTEAETQTQNTTSGLISVNNVSDNDGLAESNNDKDPHRPIARNNFRSLGRSFKELRKSGRPKNKRSPIFKKGFASSTLRIKERSLGAALQYNNFSDNHTAPLVHNSSSQPPTSLMNVPSEYAPRLCHLHKLPNFSGYGFNLQSQRLSNLQVIGKVEDGSPAQLAGLQESDIIIEVNGVNVLNENHKQVVARIIDGVIRDGQKFPDEVVLLVVDEKSKQWFDNQKISISYNLPNIVFSATPTVERRKPDQSPEVLNTSNREWRSSLSVMVHPKHLAPVESKNNSRLYGSSNDVSKYDSEKNTPGNGLNLNMTAAEFRELLKKRGKKDPRKNCNLNMEEKYKIIQNM